ncbi:hypothetical protein [Senegalia massiliensis]|uniref:hypothetical protein n=1 Tax=Senegalia massiliensis TaxID=1720316 RepID=UPI001031E224|nr:hypothetical protein [Senegalia massiliensis]
MVKYVSLIFDTKIDDSGFKKGVNSLKSSDKASIEFEYAFSGFRKTVEGTEENFKIIEKGILDMYKRMPQYIRMELKL